MTDSSHSKNGAGRQGATTHFGDEEVPLAEKQQRVAAVFRSVAGRYDVMNDIMSLGSHRLIKRFAVQLSAVRRGHTVLDLAGGTGDLSVRFARLVGDQGQVVLADINPEMLNRGRERLINRGLMGRNRPIIAAQVNAEQMPFPDDTFDCICIAYGLRNVTDKEAALAAIRAALKPGGRVVILEFSQPRHPLLGKAFNTWSALWPAAGRAVTGDSDSYRYLIESIRKHPDQDTLLTMMNDAGLTDCRCHDVMGGISAIHIGFKPATPDATASLTTTTATPTSD